VTSGHRRARRGRVERRPRRHARSCRGQSSSRRVRRWSQRRSSSVCPVETKRAGRRPREVTTSFATRSGSRTAPVRRTRRRRATAPAAPAAAWSARPCLARSAGAGERQQTGRRQERDDLAQLAFPAAERRQRHRQVVAGGASRDCNAGRTLGRSGCVTWWTRSGRVRSASRCSPRSMSPTPAERWSSWRARRRRGTD